MKIVRSLVVLAVAVILIGALVALLGRDRSDGSTGDPKVAFVSQATPDCKIGGVSPLKVRRVGGVVVRRSPPTILACGTSPAYGQFYVVGFDTNNGLCVSVDSIGQGETYGVICRDPRIPWIDFCKAGPGCVLRYTQAHDFNVVLGVVTPRVKGIRASVGGAPEVEDVAIAQVGGGLLRRLHRKEPVGFFAAFVPRCVPADDVRLEMLNAERSRIALMRETGGPPSSCQ